MADNITLDPGTGGAILNTDEIWDGATSTHFQYVKLTDGSRASSAAVSADFTNGLDVDVTRVQGTVLVSGGGGNISAYVANQPTVSAQLSGGGSVSAWPAGTYAVSGHLSAVVTNVAAVSGSISAALFNTGLALSSQFPGQLAGQTLSAIPYELSVTSAVIPASAGFRTFVYGIMAIGEASAGWHRWTTSGAAISAHTGYQRVEAFGGYANHVSPPAYMYEVSAGAVFHFQASSLVSAIAGKVNYWRAI